MGELLLEGSCGEGGEFVEAQWCVERRFRVTEVFLAVLWVRMLLVVRYQGEFRLIFLKCCASAYLSFFFTDCLMSRWSVRPYPCVRSAFALLMYVAGF